MGDKVLLRLGRGMSMVVGVGSRYTRLLHRRMEMMVGLALVSGLIHEHLVHLRMTSLELSLSILLRSKCSSELIILLMHLHLLHSPHLLQLLSLLIILHLRVINFTNEMMELFSGLLNLFWLQLV